MRSAPAELIMIALHQATHLGIHTWKELEDKVKVSAALGGLILALASLRRILQTRALRRTAHIGLEAQAPFSQVILTPASPVHPTSS